MSKSANQSDIEEILSHRRDNGSDYWSGPGRKIYVGNPYSTIAALSMLFELGVESSHEAVAGGLELILGASRTDGRIRVGPKSPLYPCYTAEAARVLCRFGLVESDAVRDCVEYFVGNADGLGGWRCNFTKFGRGPETECANPGATLYALDVLRFIPTNHKGNPVVDDAVEFLLDHWELREPLGPCHWGIGSTFMKIEFPFIRYNLFYYVYVLSFFARSINDRRFREALLVLKSKCDDGGKIIVENPHRRLSKLEFCKRGVPSEAATGRYHEILQNVSNER